MDHFYTRTQLILIQLLFQASKKEPLLTENAASIIHITSRTVKSELAVLKPLFRENGAEIISRAGYGSYLKIMDSAAYARWRNEVYGVIFSYGYDYSQNDEMIKSLTMLICSPKEYCHLTMDDLCERLYCSRTVLRNYLNAARDFLNSWNLQLVSTVKDGFQVKGKEWSIRFALMETLQKDYTVSDTNEIMRNIFQIKDTTRVENVLNTFLQREKLDLDEPGYRFLENYILLSLHRIQTGCCLEKEEAGCNVPIFSSIQKLAENISPVLNNKAELQGILFALQTASVQPADSIRLYSEEDLKKAEDLLCLIQKWLEVTFTIPKTFMLSASAFKIVILHMICKTSRNIGKGKVMTRNFTAALFSHTPIPLFIAGSIRNYLYNCFGFDMMAWDLRILYESVIHAAFARDITFHPVRAAIVGSFPEATWKDFCRDKRIQDQPIFTEMSHYHFYDTDQLNSKEYDCIMVNRQVNISTVECPLIHYDFYYGSSQRSFRTAMATASVKGFHLKEHLKKLPVIDFEENYIDPAESSFLFQISLEWAVEDKVAELYRFLQENRIREDRPAALQAMPETQTIQFNVIMIPKLFARQQRISVVRIHEPGPKLKYALIANIDFQENMDLLRTFSLLAKYLEIEIVNYDNYFAEKKKILPETLQDPLEKML